MKKFVLCATWSTAFRFPAIALMTFCLILSGNAVAEGSLTAKYERVIQKSPSDVWQIVGDFNGLHVWHPAVVKTDATANGNTAGDRRLLTLGDGATIDEELTGFDADGMQLSYKILEGPLPVSNYASTISVSDNGDGGAKVVWSSTFDANGVSDDEAVEAITGIYVAGLDALNE